MRGLLCLDHARETGAGGCLTGPRRRNSLNAAGALTLEDSRNAPFSYRNRLPMPASQIRRAFCSIVVNTGSSSPGELLITWRTSDVAVCCCRDSRSSLSRRVFSMAMRAWLAKFLTSSICLSVNGRTSWRYMLMVPINAPSLSIGTKTIVRTPHDRRGRRILACHRGTEESREHHRYAPPASY